MTPEEVVKLKAFPESLRSLRQWVAWDYETRVAASRRRSPASPPSRRRLEDGARVRIAPAGKGRSGQRWTVERVS